MENRETNIMNLFAEAISMLLNENEGIVVNTSKEAQFVNDTSAEKVIIYHTGGQIKIVSCTQEDLEAGELVWMIEDNPN